MEIFKRYVMLCVGLLIVAFGVAFSILADLGTSPISCPPYVASMLCPLTVGEATIVMHCIFILIQMALLRKDYDWVQLMQLPVAYFHSVDNLEILLSLLMVLITEMLISK